ncbi:DUF4926 domain-containing protein [Desulfobulbus sp. US4]|nr:DUF4926 domain-containing protein [Desulfobulbus sp. US4]
MKANIGDIVELIRDIPEHRLQAEMRAAIVHCHDDDAVYELEFTDAEGETLAIAALDVGQFIPVWRAETEQWVSPTEQAAALLSSLPEETVRQVLDFARFLSLRVSGSSAVKAG